LSQEVPVYILREAATLILQLAMSIEQVRGKATEEPAQPPMKDATSLLKEAVMNRTDPSVTHKVRVGDEVIDVTRGIPESLRESVQSTLDRANEACIDYGTGTDLKDKIQLAMKHAGLKLHVSEEDQFLGRLQILESTVRGSETDIVMVQHAMAGVENVLDDLAAERRKKEQLVVDQLEAERLKKEKIGSAATMIAPALAAIPDPFPPRESRSTDVEDSRARIAEAAIAKKLWMPKKQLFPIFAVILGLGMAVFFFTKSLLLSSPDEKLPPPIPLPSANSSSEVMPMAATEMPHGQQPMSEKNLDIVNKAQGAYGNAKCWHSPKLSQDKPYVYCQKNVSMKDPTNGTICYDVTACSVIFP
jgi:hypothetical protein